MVIVSLFITPKNNKIMRATVSLFSGFKVLITLQLFALLLETINKLQCVYIVH